ncbi:hypothetical protein Gmet_0590 [Geobacter metallireducens GS-15]|uniref:Carboxypeptidase regulatory-like domain-containing protein n=1 Tax=Geobacter metallireducens (strain ATCC 53774 / DSM 7210 / GS-15) TaxID=269799 RepID=Q39Y41_GEOMG|nr:MULTISPECIES: carboxypeptidase-like regulatory domain-containing protein [Geobacter]ABB30833.2 hypothetical protein Gmet_0590 [Geobacter metallireducens GS-15]MBT1075404.1 carboxypeptidase regulatory-like domain-containing protein [Geobacter grbiciae]
MKNKMIGFFLMVFFCSIQAVFAADDTGTITGKWITKEYGPMTDAQVLLFNVAKGPPPAGHKYLRTPDMGTPVDQEGGFRVQAPAGRYYLVMLKRVDPNSAGPPREGDPQYYARDKKGKPKEFVVKAGKTTNIGTITEAVPYRKGVAAVKDGTTGIEGTVTDKQGQPVAGIRVFAYEAAEMQGMPRYASNETGADGKYVLVLTGKGTYFLKARTHYGGGKPAEGEFLGAYGSGPVVVDGGQLRQGIDIQVTRFSTQQRKQQ